MPKRHVPPEVKQQAIVLAAGDNQSAAARQLGISPSTVSRLVAAEDPATMAALAQRKTAMLRERFLNSADEALKRVLDNLQTVPIDTAKDLQAVSTSYGILYDKHVGQAAAAGGRFGSASLLDGWTEGDRVTLERIERVTLEHGDPQG